MDNQQETSMNINLPQTKIPNGYASLSMVATMLGVCPQTVHYQVKKGTVPSDRFGRNTAIKISDISTLAAHLRLGGRKPTRPEAVVEREATISARRERIEQALAAHASNGAGVFDTEGFQQELAEILG